MKRIKKYIAKMLICVVLTTMVSPINVNAESVQINNVMKIANITDKKYSTDAINNNTATEKSEIIEQTESSTTSDNSESMSGTENNDTTEGTKITENEEITESKDTTESEEIAESTDKTESEEITESTDTTESKEIAESTDTTESTEAAKSKEEKDVTNDETITSEETDQSNNDSKEDESKANTETETEEKQEINKMTTNELSETVSDLYEDTNLDSTGKYTTKTLIVISDYSDFEDYDATNIINYDNMYILQYETEDATKNAYKKLKKDNNIISVELDAVIESQTEGIETTESSIEKSDLALFLDSKDKKSDVKVAILDTGIDVSNEIFQDRIIDLNINLSSTGNENSIEDDNGHGTDMAKIIVNNTPSTVKIMPIKIANDSGKATVLNAYLGIKLAIENNADIINISMGTVSSSTSTILSNIIEEAVLKGIIVVAAAGNDNANVEKYTPANIDSVITISATDNNGSINEISNYGNMIDYSSFGENGTSTATANVSSIIAIIKSIYSEYSLDDIHNLLKEYAVDLGEEGFDKYYGNGFISLESLESEITDTEKEENNIFDNFNWKNLSNDEFNKALFQSEQYMVGKFLSELNEEDFNLALSKSEYLNNITVISTFDDDGYISSQEEIICYKYCLNEYEMVKDELQTYGSGEPSNTGTKFAASSATVYVNINSTDGAFTSTNRVTLKGKSKKNLSSYTVWVNGHKALTGITMTTTSENTGGSNLSFAIATKAWSFGIYLTGSHKDSYPKSSYIRQAGVVFKIKYKKPTGYQLNSVSGSYPAAMFSGLNKNGTGTAGSESAQLWKYGSNSNSNYTGNSKGNSDNANSTSAFNTSIPNIWIVGDLQEIISSSPTLTITYKPIQYLQIVKVRYEKEDGTYGDYIDDVSNFYNYGQTFSWSKAGTTVYEEAEPISPYTVTSTNTTERFIKRNSNISASATVSSQVTPSGWYKDKPNVTFTGSEVYLNIRSITVNNNTLSKSSTSVGTVEGTNNFEYYATNVNGVNSEKKTLTLKVDASKPVKVSITSNNKNWTNNNVPLTIQGQDTVSGLAAMTVQYSTNGINGWENYGKVFYSGTTGLQIDTSIYADKNGYYKLIATDQVGYETESAVYQVTNIDKSAPTLACTVEGDKKSSGWYKGDAVLNLTAYDTGGSGIKSITVNNIETAGDKRSIQVTNEGVNNYISFATDNASSRTYPSLKINIKVDKTAPQNLSMTPNTTEWTKDPIQILVKAEDIQSGVDTVELQYTTDKDDVSLWKEYKTEAFNGSNQASREIPITDNGYYRMIVTDNVGFQTISDDVLKIDNYDPTKPDGSTIGIEKNTIQWVDEPTGVEVTSYGSDNESGLSEVNVLEQNKDGKFVTVKIGKYNGETTVESTNYDTHENNYFLTEVIDQANNKLAMKDREALEVDNIDPKAPDLTIESISSQEGYISTSKGYIIQAVIEDNQSGYSNAVLQKLNEDGEWEETDTEYEIVSETTTDQEIEEESETVQEEKPKLTKVAKERVMVAATSITSLTADKESEVQNVSETDTTQELRKQGDSKVIIEYTVRENGTYRLKGADLVQNTAYTNDTIEINNLDGSMPEIKVEGNPTIWQNTNATITVIATDAETNIAKMTLDGEEQGAKINKAGEYYFTFDATKNQEFTVTAEDEAGNTTTQKIDVTKIDKEQPVIVSDINKTWLSMLLKDYRNLKVEGSDSLSGIAKVSVTYEDKETTIAEYAYEKAKSSYQGNYKIYNNGEYIITLTDQAGNITKQTVAEANLDFSAPFITVDGNPARWQNIDATIKVSAMDEDSDISKMTLDGEEQEFTLNEKGEFYFTVVVTKNQDFTVAAYDAAGNATFQNIQVTKIDKELPVLHIIPDTAWNQDGYRNMNYNGADELSGVAEIAIEHEGVKEILSSFEYEKEQPYTSNDYRILQNGEYVISIKDHAGNSSKQSITETDAKILKAIEVMVPPDKTVYYEEEDFEKKGMVVDAIYNDSSRKENIKKYIILNGTGLPVEQTKIDLSYTEKGVTVYTDTPIQIEALSDSPKPEEPIVPETPIAPTPTPIIKETPEIETKKVSKEPAVKVEDNKTESVLQEVKEKPPIGTILAGAGLLLLLLLFLLTNVKVYSKDMEGEWKFLGKTRAIKAKDCYVVKLSKLFIMRAESDSYKFVFSKAFKKTHEECEVIVKIEQKDYERQLTKDSDTIYVEHKA